MFLFLADVLGIGGIVRWIFSIWNKLPDKVKQETINTIISTFIEMFKKYYRYYKNSQKTSEG